jgi:hypothetical protein
MTNLMTSWRGLSRTIKRFDSTYMAGIAWPSNPSVDADLDVVLQKAGEGEMF